MIPQNNTDEHPCLMLIVGYFSSLLETTNDYSRFLGPCILNLFIVFVLNKNAISVKLLKSNRVPKKKKKVIIII